MIDERPASRGASGRRLRRATAAVLVASTVGAASARADVRCGTALQQNVCLEATGSCLPGGIVGPAPSAWPGFQQNQQHTGRSPYAGPTCANTIWESRIRGKILSTAAIGADGTLYVASAKYPICAFDRDTGALRWCDTDNKGKFPDYSAPAAGNGDLLYIGTRDNDMWTIDVTPPVSSIAPVAWRQKVCTDGDITTSPAIGSDGVVYMGSDSLGGGTIMAMCPGTERRIKWCINPLGGGIRNVSPALSPDGSTLYVTHGGAFLVALDAASGDRLWDVQLETRRNGLRGSNYTPVVDPTTGKVYVGLDEGLFVVTPPTPPLVLPTVGLLFPTYASARENMESPPALDTTNGTIFVLASRGQRPSLYAIGFDGTLKWKKDYTQIGRGRGRSTPPIVDVNGNVYVVTKKVLHAFDANGVPIFQFSTPRQFAASPILDDGRLYVGSIDGRVSAIGDCP